MYHVFIPLVGEFCRGVELFMFSVFLSTIKKTYLKMKRIPILTKFVRLTVVQLKLGSVALIMYTQINNQLPSLFHHLKAKPCTLI